MEKINFQNNITKANAETMNQLQDNVENAINLKQDAGDYALKSDIAIEYSLFTAQHISSSIAASGWRNIIEDYTTPIIKKGKYLIIFSYILYNAASGSLSTTRITIDGSEYSPSSRSTIPLTNLSMSGQNILYVQFNEDATHTLRAETYPSSTINGGCTNATFRFIRLGD